MSGKTSTRGRRKAGGRGRSGRAANGTVAVADLVAAKRFVEKSGGIDNARELLKRAGDSGLAAW